MAGLTPQFAGPSTKPRCGVPCSKTKSSNSGTLSQWWRPLWLHSSRVLEASLTWWTLSYCVFNEWRRWTSFPGYHSWCFLSLISNKSPSLEFSHLNISPTSPHLFIPTANPPNSVCHHPLPRSLPPLLLPPISLLHEGGQDNPYKNANVITLLPHLPCWQHFSDTPYFWNEVQTP